MENINHKLNVVDFKSARSIFLKPSNQQNKSPILTATTFENKISFLWLTVTECSTWNLNNVEWIHRQSIDPVMFEQHRKLPSEMNQLSFIHSFNLKQNLSDQLTFPSTGFVGFFISSVTFSLTSSKNLSASPFLVCINVTQMWMLKQYTNILSVWLLQN